MKNSKYLLSIGLLFLCLTTTAQVGINTQTPNSTLEVNGSFSRKISQITSTTNLQIDHSVVICNPSTAIDINLPNATSCLGRIYIIKNTTSNSVTLKPQNGQNIEGLSTFLMQHLNATIQLVSDGSNWYILDKYIP